LKLTSATWLSAGQIKWLSVKKDWKGLKSIGVEKKIIEKKNGQIINEDRYFICSIEIYFNYISIMKLVQFSNYYNV